MYEWCLESAQRADEAQSTFTLVFRENREYRIGRTLGFDIVSSNLLVSRNHGIITFKPDGRIYIRDLKSFNGTFLNDERIESSKDILLETGDLLGIGATSTVHVQKKDLFWVRRKQLGSNSPELPHLAPSVPPVHETKKILEVLQVENNIPSTSFNHQKNLVNKYTRVNISDKKKSEETCAKNNIESKNSETKKENNITKESSSNRVLKRVVKSNTKDIADENNINLKNTRKENDSVNNVIETETKITNSFTENNLKNDVSVIKELINSNLPTECKTAEICLKKETNFNLKINKTEDYNKKVEITSENQLSNININIEVPSETPSSSNQNKDLKITEETPSNLEMRKTSDINKYKINETANLELPKNSDNSLDVKKVQINEVMGEIYEINSDDENYDECIFVKQEIKTDLKNHSFTQNDEDDIVLISDDDEDVFPRSQLFELKKEPTDTNLQDHQEDLNIKNEIADYDDYNDNDNDNDEEDDLICKWYMKLSQSQEFHALRKKEEIENEPQEDNCYYPTFDDNDLEIDIEKHEIEIPEYLQENEDSFSPQENLEINKETSEKVEKTVDKLSLDKVDSGPVESSKLPTPEIADLESLQKKQDDLLQAAKNEALKLNKELRVVIPNIGNKEKEFEDIFDDTSKKKLLEKNLESSKLPSSKEAASKHSKDKEKKKWYLKPPVIDAPHLPTGKRKASEEPKLNEPSTSTKKKPKPTVEYASTSSTSLSTPQGSSIHIDKSVRTELDKRKKRKKKSVEIYTKDTKLRIQEDRKKKLKEIASKKVTTQSTTEKCTKEQQEGVQKPHTKPKVKVSSGRGLFLTGEEKTKETSAEGKTKESSLKKKTELQESKKGKAKESTIKKKSTELGPGGQKNKESSLKKTAELESSSKKKTNVTAEKETADKSKESSLKKKANTELEEPLAKKKYKIQKISKESLNKAPPLRKLSFNDLNTPNAEPSKLEKPKPVVNQISKKDYPECSHQPVSAKKLKGILMLPISDRVCKEKKSVRIIAEPQIKYIERSPGNNCRKVNSKDAPIPNIIKTQAHNEVLSTLLCWKPAWLEEQKRMPNSPQVSKRNPMRMLTNFNSVGDYIEIVIPLMLLELWSQVYKDWCFNNSQIKLSHIVEIDRKLDGLLCLSCYCLAERDETDNYPKMGDLLIVEYYFDVDSKVATTKKFGYVLNSMKRRMDPTDIVHQQFSDYGPISPFKVHFTLLINCPANIKILKEKLIRIRLVSRITSALRLFKPVACLKSINFSNLILKPNTKQYKVSKPTQMTTATEDELNTDQMICIFEAYQICTRNEPGIYMIQGPPGTGKSFVIKNLVRQLLCDASKNSNLQKHRILLCAPSNGAIDEITNTLLDMRSTLPKNNRFKMIRLGPPNSIHNPIVRRITLPELVSTYIKTQQNNNLKNNYFINDEYRFLHQKENTIINTLESLKARNKDCSAELLNLKRVQEQISHLSTNNSTHHNRRALEREAEYNYLINADIICTTLSSCVGSKLEEMVREKKIEFTCCIIDEATQSNEQETLIPLLLNINKFVLVGDPEQLPPTTLSKEAKHLGYGNSLFSRLQNCFDYLSDNPIRMLTHQYRMHSEICKFPSNTFYGGKLKSAELVIKRQENILDPCSLFCLNNVLDFKETEYQNKIEADLVLVITDLIIRRTRYNVGIITPYTKQKDYLIRKWRTMRSKDNQENMEEDRNLSRVAINTVDGFQGQERDVIIISAVRYRSNLFLNDTQRLNVALTRAKHAVYICAHVNLFKTESIWQKLEIEAKSRNFYYLLTEQDVVNERYLSKLLFRQ